MFIHVIRSCGRKNIDLVSDSFQYHDLYFFPKNVASPMFVPMAQPRQQKGICDECRIPVFNDQTRTKNERGAYVHMQCFKTGMWDTSATAFVTSTVGTIDTSATGLVTSTVGAIEKVDT